MVGLVMRISTKNNIVTQKGKTNIVLSIEHESWGDCVGNQPNNPTITAEMT